MGCEVKGAEEARRLKAWETELRGASTLDVPRSGAEDCMEEVGRDVVRVSEGSWVDPGRAAVTIEWKQEFQ